MRLFEILTMMAICSSDSFSPQIASRHTRASSLLTGTSSTSLFESNKKAQVQLSMPSTPEDLSPTSILDYALSLVTSDLSSIVLGSVGILLALSNRLSSIDYEATLLAANEAADMGAQSRMDLLAVFSAGAVLLNGVSKLDVTSALAESVVLDGKALNSVEFASDKLKVTNIEKDLEWALGAVKQCSPAKSAVILGHDGLKWQVLALSGIVPEDENLWKNPVSLTTPILDRFLKEGQGNKESYLPTLQALPGRTEFTYLPQNTQEVLLLPIDISSDENSFQKLALALGGDTAKTFTPRDIAWCQILASRIGNLWK
eukprot:274781_1